jgi:hypothetical protein
LRASTLYKIGKPVIVIQKIFRHKHPTTTNRYLGSLGLEDTRTHLEDLCNREGADKDPAGNAIQVKNGEPAKVIALKDHLAKRSRAV